MIDPFSSGMSERSVHNSPLLQGGWQLWFSRHNWLTWLGLSLIVPLGLFYWQHYTEHLRQQQQAIFAQHADKLEHDLYQRLKHIELLLGANVAFVSSSEHVSQDEWQHYVQSINLPEVYPGVQAAGIVSFRSNTQLPDLLAQLNQELSLHTAVTVNPAGARAQYAIVSHIQPMTDQNRAVLGFDILTEPQRAQTALRAASLNQPAITSKITLQQDKSGSAQPGLLLLLPFYQKGLPLVTAAQKQAALAGFVYAAFRINDILPSAWHDSASVLPDIEWFSGVQPVADQLLFARSLQTASQPSIELQQLRPLAWYGQSFVLRIQNNALFEQRLLPLAEFELVVLGSTALVLLFLLLSYLNLRRYQAQSTARQLQQQIQQQRQALRVDEQRQGLALKASQLAWFEFDFRTGGAFYADVWWQMFDFVAPQPNPEPQQLFDLLHPSALVSFREHLQRLLANGPDQDQQQYRFVSRQGRQLYCLVHFYVVRAPEGDAIRLCCTMQDLTVQQQQRTKRQLLARVCQLELTQTFAVVSQGSATAPQRMPAFMQQHHDWLLQFYLQQFTDDHQACSNDQESLRTTALSEPMLPVGQLIDDVLRFMQATVKTQELLILWQPQPSHDFRKLQSHQGWQLLSSLVQLVIHLAAAQSQIKFELVPFQTRLTLKVTLPLTEQLAAEVSLELAAMAQSPELACCLLQQKWQAVKFWASQQGVEFDELQAKQQLTLRLRFV
ncbi:MAG: CHASE domain-containing protein [Rheinheimera sp.]